MRNMEVVRLCSETLHRVNSKPQENTSFLIESSQYLIHFSRMPLLSLLLRMIFVFFFETCTQIGCFNFISSRNCKVSESLYRNKTYCPSSSIEFNPLHFHTYTHYRIYTSRSLWNRIFFPLSTLKSLKSRVIFHANLVHASKSSW